MVVNLQTQKPAEHKPFADYQPGKVSDTRKNVVVDEPRKELIVNLQTASYEAMQRNNFPSNEKSQAETVLAVVPLEDCKLREEPYLSGTEAQVQVTHPESQSVLADDPKFKLDDSAMLSGTEALADNSTVVVK